MSIIELAQHLDRIMRRIDAEMHRRVPAVDAEGLGPLGASALHRLHRLAPAPIHALVAAMGRDPSQVSRVVRRLEETGLVKRDPDPEDGRIRVLDLTARGRSQVAEIERIMRDVLDELMAPLSDEEKESLLRILRRIER